MLRINFVFMSMSVSHSDEITFRIIIIFGIIIIIIIMAIEAEVDGRNKSIRFHKHFPIFYLLLSQINFHLSKLRSREAISMLWVKLSHDPNITLSTFLN
jgi:hypothetical protein